jgi:hypothetical protein
MNTDKDSFEYQFRQKFNDVFCETHKLAKIDNTIIFKRQNEILNLFDELLTDSYNRGLSDGINLNAYLDRERKNELLHKNIKKHGKN